MDIRVNNLRGPENIGLMVAHRHTMFAHSPPESLNALDRDAYTSGESPSSQSGKAIVFWAVVL